MRRAFVAVLLLSASVASAQSTNPTSPWRLTLFTSDIGVTHTESSGSDFTGGLGLGLAYAPNERWSAEFAVAAQRYNAVYTEFRPLGPGIGTQLVPYTSRRDFNSFPISATARYHFVNRSRWTPFVLAGVRHVQAPERGPTIGVAGVPFLGVFHPVTEGFVLDDRTSGEAGGGVIVGLTDRVGLVLEGRHLLRSDGAPHDPLQRFSVGVSWKF